MRETPDMDYSDLQKSYGGRYVAQLHGRVIASAKTYGDLSQQLDESGAGWRDLLIEYVEPVDVIGVY